MTTLVTGGAGFIGSHLTESLLSSGEDVIVLDDLSTGNEQNLAAVLDHPSLQFVKGSILDASLVDELVGRARTVYHLAAAVGTFTILDKTLESLRTNLHGTENVIDSAFRHGARVLIASTSEVYGKNTKIGLREDDDRHVGSPLKNRWSYAEAKAIDETLAYLYAVEHGLQTVIVRLVQHGRPASDRPLRHGDPAVRRAGARWRATHRVRDRQPGALLLSRPRRGACPSGTDGGQEQRIARSSTSAAPSRCQSRS